MTHKTTPLLQQYHELKALHPEKLLFFQVGDFYELFFKDAQVAAQFLGIALTKRGKDKGQDVPLCGVPVHALEHYLTKLIKGGFCVALCDQLEPAQTGKVVKRGITKVFTPGTLTDDTLLESKSASYILSFAAHADQWSLLFAEIMTAQLYATTLTSGAQKLLETELTRFFPDEVVLPLSLSGSQFETLFKKAGYYTSCASSSCSPEELSENLQQILAQQQTTNATLYTALSTLCSYFSKNNPSVVPTFSQLHEYKPEDFLLLDSATQKNLEIIHNMQDGSSKNTLFQTLDVAVTAMGSRTLKKWLVRPLLSQTMIEHRLDTVEYFVKHHTLTEKLRSFLKTCADVERIVGRISLRRATVRDYLHLKDVLFQLPTLHTLCTQGPRLLQTYTAYPPELLDLAELLEKNLALDQEHGLIRPGSSAELDRLKALLNDSTQVLLELEKSEQKKSGINSLKIRYNSIQGYYVEITHANAHLVPDYYKRRQTLVNKERYTFPELDALQYELLHAQANVTRLEQELFEALKETAALYVGKARKVAHHLGQLDALASFAWVAYHRRYTRPVFNASRDIVITAGKHPVIEQALGSAFIPNDTRLTDDACLLLITGPNMGGKSTYLRQTALITIMAQCGSFVPAQSANLSLVDRIFTRIGASDNVAAGKSTFLLEMEETAHICQFATKHSLVILDEVGRGTSTQEGRVLAQAIVEYIYTKLQARCLFATHYHELTDLAVQYPGIVNYHATSTQTPEGILFLHTIAPGIAHGSFGIEVAKLAHLPVTVVKRAQELLETLSDSASPTISAPPTLPVNTPELSELKAKLKSFEKYKILKEVDYQTLSPKKAFDLIWSLQE